LTFLTAFNVTGMVVVVRLKFCLVHDIHVNIFGSTNLNY
jgi:hypothetical protein